MKSAPILLTCLAATLAVIPASGEEESVAPMAREEKQQTEISRKLCDIIIPSFRLDGLSLEETCVFLAQRTGELGADKKPLRIQVEGDDLKRLKVRSLGLDDVPVGVALAYAAAKTGTRMVVKGDVIRFRAAGKDAPAGASPEDFANTKAAPVSDPAGIVIPEVVLKDAILDDAIDLIRMRSAEFDPARRGVNIVSLVDAKTAKRLKNLRLEKRTVREVLEEVAKATATRVVFASHAVEFRPIQRKPG